MQTLVFDAAAVARGVLLAVADGVGGEAAGEVASRYVLEKLGAIVTDAPGDVELQKLAQWFSDVGAALNASLCEQAEATPGRHGMATTLTGLYIAGTRRCWVNAGDSRLYALSGGKLVQVSRDHTLREVTGNPRIPGNIIVNCFGTKNRFYLDTGVLPADASLFLLCSDGLSDYADAGQLERIVREAGGVLESGAPGRDGQERKALADAARKLVDAALAGGGGDNITAVLVWVRYL